MGALRELLAKLDIEVTGTDKVHKAESALGSFKEGLEKVGKFLAVGAIAEGVKSMVEGLESQAVQLSKTSQILGINTQDLQAWQFAAKLSGVEAEAFAGGVKKLEINAGKAAEAGAQTGGEFQKLGVNLREGAGGPMRDVQEILHDTGMAIAKLPDPMTRADAVMKTFGKSGSALIPLFNKGEAGLAEMLNEIDKLGGGISEQAIAQLEDMHQATSKWDMALTSAKSALVVEFLPALTGMLSGLTKGVASIMGNKVAMDGLKSGVIALGIVGAAAGLEFIAPWIPAIAGFVLLAAVVDEFRVGLAGGKTVIGDVLDQLFGKGAGQSFFATVKKDVEAGIAKIKELIAILKGAQEGGTPGGESGRTHAIAEATGLETKITGNQEEVAAKRALRDRDFKAADESLNPLNWRRKMRAYSNEDKGWFESDKDFTARKSEDANALRGQIGIQRAGITDETKTSEAFAALFNTAKGNGAAYVPGGATGSAGGTPKGPTNVTQSNSTTINITAPSGDAKDIADAAGGAVQEQNRANLAAVQTMAPKS